MPEGVVSRGGADSGAPPRDPLIITCALTGDHAKRSNPWLPVTLEEQVASAIEAAEAGAAIIHLHVRDPHDSSRPANSPDAYRRVNDAIRAAVPGVLLDNTQMTEVIEVSGRFQDTIVAFTSANVAAKPDIMSLNPGPMTFRGSGGSPSRVAITTFDETARMANDYRAHGVKPQVFLYHPGHLDLLDHLIRFDAIDPPYFVQLVFGQQSGIPATADAFALMVRHLPEQSVYQTCGLGPDSIAFNLLALQAGGHARTGMEDSLDLLPGVPAKGNGPLVSRVASIARSIGREIATPSQARETLGI